MMEVCIQFSGHTYYLIMFNMQQLPVKSISISYCALWKLNNFILYFIRLQNSLACKDGDLKLVGSKSENEGRLEVCFDQRWGTINENGWTHIDTQVTCRQLGYSTSGTCHYRLVSITTAYSIGFEL